MRGLIATALTACVAAPPSTPEPAPLRTGGDAFYEEWRDLRAFEQRIAELGTSGHAEVVELGTTVEGRPLLALRLAAGDPTGRPGILVTALLHAREWSGGAAALYTAERLVSDYGAVPEVTDLLDSGQVLVVPVANPDGYAYTWTTDRMWRKTRRDHGNGAFGVDLNRNYATAWGKGGSSGATTSGTYRGAEPFSEPESRGLRDWLVERPGFSRHIDLHQRGQVVLTPWSYRSTPTFDHDALAATASDMEAALEAAGGLAWDSGTYHDRLYRSSGTIIDWTWAERGMHSFLIELRDRGHYGMMLPAEQVRPSAEEVWAAFLALSQASLERPLLLAFDAATCTARVQRSEPGAPVHLVGSEVGPGTTSTPLGVMALDQAELLASGTADADGSATLACAADAPPWIQASSNALRSAVQEHPTTP